jgi:acyl-CoA-binding protein
MGVDQEFEAAVDRAKSLPPQSNETLLDLYALYKQATVGDVTGEPPGMFDFKGRAKFEAWSSRRGMSRDEARQAYAELVRHLAAD